MKKSEVFKFLKSKENSGIRKNSTNSKFVIHNDLSEDEDYSPEYIKKIQKKFRLSTFIKQNIKKITNMSKKII